jgi:hypothetical protein
MIGDRPQSASAYRELKNKRMLGVLEWRLWCVSRRLKNLNTGAVSSPGTANAKAAKAVLTAYFKWSDENRRFDLFANSIPLRGVERRSPLDPDDPSVAVRKDDSAGIAAKG